MSSSAGEQHSDNDTYARAADLMMQAGERDDLELLRETLHYASLVGAICMCRCERCEGIRNYYVAAWKRIVAVYDREGRTWGWNRISKP